MREQKNTGQRWRSPLIFTADLADSWSQNGCHNSTVIGFDLAPKQGMTIRTARLPGAGNLLGRAGEDLSGLPNRARRYHFFYY